MYRGITSLAVLALLQGQAMDSSATVTKADAATCLVSSTSLEDDEGKELYMKACATCHGANGKGRPASELGFETPLPDFSDCNFATREPDADWIAVAHQGGPVRGFAQEMPAFGDALTEEELQKILNFIRTLCTEDQWPRGELNLPRAFITEKAYPEDETVLSTTIETEDRTVVISELVYEKRFGARNQIELAVPVGVQENGSGAQLGDVTLGLKRVMLQSLSTSSILSLHGEVVLPTGNAEAGIGKGITIIEPTAIYNQGLWEDFFLQFQGGLELPLEREETEDEAFFRGVVGKTLTEGKWGRAWSPMVEFIGTQGLGSDADNLQVDIAPQVQVSLNQRQHVMLNVGLRVPVGESTRPTQFMIYLLWEWFDGGFFEGW